MGLAAVLLAVLGLLTVAPFVVALGVAERRGLDVTRWGLGAAGCVLGGLLFALLAVRADRTVVLVALALAATWLGPVLAAGVPRRLGGRRGRHV